MRMDRAALPDRLIIKPAFYTLIETSLGGPLVCSSLLAMNQPDSGTNLVLPKNGKKWREMHRFRSLRT